MKKVKILKQNKNERLLGTLILHYLAKYIVNQRNFNEIFLYKVCQDFVCKFWAKTPVSPVAARWRFGGK